MIDNKELIKPLLDFEKEGDFFMLYIFKRKKDQPEGEKDNNQSVRTIKTYCINSIEHLESRYEEVKQLCEIFKARAYIHVQRQNHRDVGLSMMVELATRLKDGASKQHNLFDSVVGQLKVAEKRWIIDIDDKDFDVRTIQIALSYTQPLDIENKVLAIIPTRNGSHLITTPFNVDEFRKKGYNQDIQKKNPTLLYYPNSLE